MPIKQSAMKALRQAKKRTVQNRKVKEGIAYLRREVRIALDAKEVKHATELAQKTIKALDKAVQNKVMKKNTVGRLKSRLVKKINALQK